MASGGPRTRSVHRLVTSLRSTVIRTSGEKGHTRRDRSRGKRPRGDRQLEEYVDEDERDEGEQEAGPQPREASAGEEPVDATEGARRQALLEVPLELEQRRRVGPPGEPRAGEAPQRPPCPD